MKLECDVCKEVIHKKTEEIYIVTVNNHEALLCEYHANKELNKVGKHVTPNVD